MGHFNTRVIFSITLPNNKHRIEGGAGMNRITWDSKLGTWIMIKSDEFTGKYKIENILKIYFCDKTMSTEIYDIFLESLVLDTTYEAVQIRINCA